ncbi:amidohydrolase family protein [Mesorhizobium loti]|uniref:amidohydrolase family protein n=1 Tax=Rhizobium loti TaxID=381 RepID=UPI000407D42B|nr:amidohydrolase family protein [Mesorhizobium loti]
MTLDLIIRNVRLEDAGPIVDIAVADGRIVAIHPRIPGKADEEFDAGSNFACAGFVDAHMHLDKACLLDRCAICEGTLAEAVRETSKAKSGFTEADVYERASRVVEKAIGHGTTRIRSFVEIDPRAGFRSFEAIKRIRTDYSFAIDIEICAFAQDGLTNETETFAMLDEALGDGADLVGGCPYTDPDPRRHIELIFDLAEKYDLAADFHLDFTLDPDRTDLPFVIAETVKRGWQGRVALGHVTNLSAMAPDQVSQIGARLASAGIGLAVLPATDLFLNGRGHDRLVPRGIAPADRLAAAGVAVAIATNNVLNPFTPFGDASLIRMANLYANVAQLTLDADIAAVFAMVTSGPARLMSAPYGLVVGAQADIVLLECEGPSAAVREAAPVIAGWKRGRNSFYNGPRKILRP